MNNKTTTEPRTITVQAYRDEDGQPTCAGRTEEAGCCRFVGDSSAMEASDMSQAKF